MPAITGPGDLARLDAERASCRDSLIALRAAYASNALIHGDDECVNELIDELLRRNWGQLELAALLVEAVAEQVRHARPLATGPAQVTS